MADQLERALLIAELGELQKQQSEAKLTAIYLRIAELRRQLAALDADRQVLLREELPRPFVVTPKRRPS
jgi:hypothetical protein